MTVSVSVATATVNSGNLGGNQLGARTLAMREGGSVVLWQDVPGTASVIRMQRYDAFGNAVGGGVAVATGELTDACLTANGDIAFSTILAGSLNVQVRFLSGTDLSSLGVSNLTSAVALNSAQIDATTGGSVRVMITNVNGGILAATADVSLPTMSGGGVVSVSTAGSILLEMDDLNTATNKFALYSVGVGGTSSLVDTVGNATSINSIVGASLDVVTLQSGLRVLMSSNANSMVPVLASLTGDVAAISLASFGTSVVGATIFGAGTLVGASIGAREMVELGDGRILLVWAADKGAGTITSPSGIYASVYNVTTGSIESNAVLLRAIPNGVLGVASINGTLTTDGRVALTYVAPNGLAGNDVFHTILDARLTGVTVAGTAGDDTFVGSVFADTFSNIGLSDHIVGGGGFDSVVLTGATNYQIDLADPDAFPNQGPYLSQIPNLTGGSGNDTVFGTSGFNVIDGAGGHDHIAGRENSDTLNGGAGNDTIEGGTDGDQIDGGLDADLLYGGDGDDTVIGGGGDDRVQGGAGDDLLQGSDGNDALTGGAGNDTMIGGAGDDSFLTGDGANVITGGDGNETILVTSSGNFISGDTGTDTVSYSRFDGGSLAQPWVYADLGSNPDTMAGVYGFGDVNDELTSSVENITGSKGNDFLAGNSASNLLKGGEGNDVLIGRNGSDTIGGGAGADIFVFNSANTFSDVIRDYEKDADRIALIAASFGDISGENIAARFSATATAAVQASASAQLLFDNSGGGAGRLLYDADGNGGGTAILIATLTFSDPTGLALFSATDFIFV